MTIIDISEQLVDIRDCKGHAPQNQSALAQRMIETLKAYMSHSRQLSLF